MPSLAESETHAVGPEPTAVQERVKCAPTPAAATAVVIAAYGSLGAVLLWSRALADLGHSFWNDEIVMVESYVRGGPHEILFGPGLSHELMALFSWIATQVVGESEIGLRLLSALPFVAGVALVTAWLHRRVGVLSGSSSSFSRRCRPSCSTSRVRREGTDWRSSA